MKKSFWLKTIVIVLFSLFFMFIPLIVSGDYGWLEGWLFSIIITVFSIASRVLAIRKNPGLVKERATFMDAPGIKEWDKRLLPFIVYFVPILGMLVIGLDHRLGWTMPLSAAIKWWGLFLFIVGYFVSSWAMMENRFFSSVVRIQTDRGQVVCESGPYRWVRHPGYAGALISWLATPLFLGSLWGFIPVIIEVVLYMVRTHLEDKTLQAELTGYQEYARRVRYRLLPGIW